MTILWSFTHTRVVPNLHEWLLWKTKEKSEILKNALAYFSHLNKLMGIQAEQAAKWYEGAMTDNSPDWVYVFPKGHMAHERVK